MTSGPSFLGVIILGAGRSVRMGRPKLLLPWGETSVLGHLINQWCSLGARQISVVHAADDTAIPAELDRVAFAPKDRIANPNADRGMFSSILCAAQWTGWKPALTHWAIVLGDQPHVRVGTLRQLIDFSAQQPERICQPMQNAKPRHPVVLPKSAFLELADSQSANLKEFLLGRDIAGCECDDPGLDLDIDQPEDYQRALTLAGLAIQK
jgi:molybdenum cofactor cytidylyltransferase